VYEERERERERKRKRERETGREGGRERLEREGGEERGRLGLTCQLSLQAYMSGYDGKNTNKP
jgi:hypothetical protein